jgi:hypothetical protein
MLPLNLGHLQNPCGELRNAAGRRTTARKYGLGTRFALTDLKLLPSDAKDPEQILLHDLWYRFTKTMNMEGIDQMLQAAGTLMGAAAPHRQSPTESHSLLTGNAEKDKGYRSVSLLNPRHLDQLRHADWCRPFRAGFALRAGPSDDRRRSGRFSGFHPAMVLAHSWACSLSAIAGNSRRTTIAAANSPSRSNAARMAAASSSDTTNIGQAWEAERPGARDDISSAAALTL